MLRFQCPECGFGDYEVGHLAEAETYCVVCLEEQGRQIRVECWEQGEGRSGPFARGFARCSSRGAFNLAALDRQREARLLADQLSLFSLRLGRLGRRLAKAVLQRGHQVDDVAGRRDRLLSLKINTFALELRIDPRTQAASRSDLRDRLGRSSRTAAARVAWRAAPSPGRSWPRHCHQRSSGHR